MSVASCATRARSPGPPPIHVTVGLMLAALRRARLRAHTRPTTTGQPLGLVHRDVSPSNVLVTSAGHVKVIDFGIAKAQSSQLRTQTGRVKGKLAYMAPEAISGQGSRRAQRPVRGRRDPHELLTARPLFASKNEYQTLMKVQRGDIMPPSTFNQACPPELDAIVLKALARDPDERFASAARDARRAARGAQAVHAADRLPRHRDVARLGVLARAARRASPATRSSRSSAERAPTRGARRRRGRRAIATRTRRSRWCGAAASGEGSHGGPIVLDDVPDVSEKHLAVRPETFVRTVEVEVEVISSTGGVGDIPVAPAEPRHGARAARASDRSARRRRGRRPTLDDVAAAAAHEQPAADRHARATARSRWRICSASTTSTRAGMTPRPTLAENHPPIAIGRANTQEPVVRFSSTGKVRSSARRRRPVRRRRSDSSASRRRARVPASSPRPCARPRRSRIAPATQKPVPTSVIGASMVERNKSAALVDGPRPAPARGRWRRRRVVRDEPATDDGDLQRRRRPSRHGPATVKFDVTPADSEVRIDGAAHTGSPWSTELAAGIHQIEIDRSGYTAYLTSLELAANDKHSLHIELRPLGTSGTTGEATLSVASTPSGPRGRARRRRVARSTRRSSCRSSRARTRSC